VTQPADGSDAQADQGGGTGPECEGPPPPDRSWIEFDVGIRSQDPDTITRKACNWFLRDSANVVVVGTDIVPGTYSPGTLRLTVGQTAEYCGVDRAEVYYKMLRDLEVRRIGVRRGVMPFGRLIRVERGSLLRLQGVPDPPPEELPRWVALKKAADYYQVSPNLIRRIIAREQLDARRIGTSRSIRIDRESLLQLGRFKTSMTS